MANSLAKEMLQTAKALLNHTYFDRTDFVSAEFWCSVVDIEF